MKYYLFYLFVLCIFKSTSTMELTRLSQEKFYIEKPIDKHWNLLHSPAVIEVIEEEGTLFEQYLVVSNPTEFKKKWSSVPKKRYVECSGPSRKLTRKEWMRLVHTLLPNHPLPSYIREEDLTSETDAQESEKDS